MIKIISQANIILKLSCHICYFPQIYIKVNVSVGFYLLFGQNKTVDNIPCV